MEVIHIEAIVLHSVPFKEYDRVLTLFAPSGLLKLFVKSNKRSYLQDAALTTPLTFAEYSFTHGRNELHRFIEGRVLKQNLGLRRCLETLKSAETMVQALIRSQWLGKSSPQLFCLFERFLDYLPQCSVPAALSTAFLIKIVLHEGVLQLQSPIEACLRLGSKRYPVTETLGQALFFSQEDEGLLTLMALSRSLKQITALVPPGSFQQNIQTLFSQVFD